MQNITIHEVIFIFFRIQHYWRNQKYYQCKINILYHFHILQQHKRKSKERVGSPSNNSHKNEKYKKRSVDNDSAPQRRLSPDQSPSPKSDKKNKNENYEAIDSSPSGRVSSHCSRISSGKKSRQLSGAGTRKLGNIVSCEDSEERSSSKIKSKSTERKSDKSEKRKNSAKEKKNQRKGQKQAYSVNIYAIHKFVVISWHS